jgi:hypothetical protein
MKSHPPFRLAALATTMFVLASALIGCAVSDAPEEEPLRETDLDGVDPGPSDDEEPSASVSSALYGCNQCTNCVLYARCRQPRLPYGLTYWRDKVARINSQTARAGCVAAINTGSAYGHVAYVRGVSGATIYIDEGNFSGRCSSRAGTRTRLGIAGFICP